MTRYFTFILFLTILFTSCNNADKKTENIETNVSDKDSTIYLVIKGVKKEFKINRLNHIDLKEIQDFLNKFPTIPALYIDTVKVDINGDNVDEFVISKIINDGGDFTIYSTILMHDKIINQDTLKTSNDLAFMDWGNDSIYFKLKPYSSFYDAYRDKKVVEELENGKLDGGLIEFYINGISSQLKDKNYDTTIVNHRIDSITNELQNYKGKIVTTLEHWDRSILIWNKNTSKLDLIYTP